MLVLSIAICKRRGANEKTTKKTINDSDDDDQVFAAAIRGEDFWIGGGFSGGSDRIVLDRLRVTN